MMKPKPRLLTLAVSATLASAGLQAAVLEEVTVTATKRAESTQDVGIAITAFTGAGVSAESGVPTFRDAQTGLWARYRAEELVFFQKEQFFVCFEGTGFSQVAAQLRQRLPHQRPAQLQVEIGILADRGSQCRQVVS